MKFCFLLSPVFPVPQRARAIFPSPGGRGSRGGGLRTLISLITIYLLLFTNDAQAYVDPNTGGYIFQLFYPIFVAIGIGYFFLKNQVKKLCHSFLNLIRKPFGK